MFTGHRNRNRAAWWTIIDEWRASGLSQADFCRLNGHSIKQFSRWKLKLWQFNVQAGNAVASPAETSAASSPFVPLSFDRSNAPVPGEHADAKPLTVVTGDLNVQLTVRQDGEILVSIRRAV